MLIEPTFWVKTPDENGDGILQVYTAGTEDVPIPVETHNVTENDVKMNEKQEFEIVLECAELPCIYRNNEEFYNSCEHASMAAESIIPMGLFPVDDNKQFEPSGFILLHGKVTETYNNPAQFGFKENDTLFTLTCLGNEYDCMLNGEQFKKIKIEQGNIVGGVFYVQGWPAEE